MDTPNPIPPKPDPELPDGVPTFEDLWNKAGFKDPAAVDPAIHNSVMESAGIAQEQGATGGPGIQPGSKPQVKDISFAEAFPGQKEPEETEILLRDIRDLVRDLKLSVENLATYLQSQQGRT